MGLILKDFGEHQMYLHENDAGISKTLKKPHGYQNREIEFMSLIREHVKPGQICFDIGANIGYLTLIFAKLIGESGRVYAVEPNKKNMKVLKKNIILNNYQNIITTVDKLAISNKNGEAKFFLSDSSNLGSLKEISSSNGTTKTVKTVTIDEYLKDKDLPDNYEMDAEGYEVHILNGMHKTAKKSKSGTKIFMEVHPHLYDKKLNMDRALNRMVELGFFFKYVISAAIAEPKLFKKLGYKPSIVHKSSGWYRGTYENVKNKDAIYLCSYGHKEHIPERNRTTNKIVRYIILEKG